MEIFLKKFSLILAVMAMPLSNPSNFVVNQAYATTTLTKLGDLSSMRKIVSDALSLVNTGDMKGAVKRVTEFETAWDANAARLRKLDSKIWGKIDEAADVALSTVRYSSATAEEKQKDLTDLISVLDDPSR